MMYSLSSNGSNPDKVNNMIKQIDAFANAFTVKQRDNGNKFSVLDIEEQDHWMAVIVRRAHGDMLPDDTRYKMISEIADALNERTDDCDDDLTDLDTIIDYDVQHEICDGLVDVYNSDRVAWLASHMARAAYIDDAQDEGLIDSNADTFTRIGVGQFMEYQDVCQEIIRCFMELANDGELS